MQQEQVIKIHDEQSLMENLVRDTFALIRKADNLKPIKKLIEIHDILSININILQRFKKADCTFDEIWLDVPTVKYLNHLRCSLMVYHHTEFNCTHDLIMYNREFCNFLNLIVLRLRNKKDEEIDIPKIS